MAVNLFERPVANNYNFAYFQPNFEAWQQLAGQIQQEYNQFETLAAKTPQHLKFSETDVAGYDEYLGKIQGIRDNLVDAFEQGGVQGRAAMNQAQFQIMKDWTPGGLAHQLESRLTSFTQESERIKKFYEEFGEVTPYTLAQQAAQINPLRNDAGGFQDVGNIALVNPYSTEDVTNWIKDHEGMIHETLLNNNVTRRLLMANEFESTYEFITGMKGKNREHIFKVLADAMPQDMARWFQYKHNARSYNSGGAYDPGDQMNLYDVVETKDGNGRVLRKMVINEKSELAQTLWAVANGAAYVDPIISTHSFTDWRARKNMELELENPSFGFTVQGPGIASNSGGLFNGAKNVSDVAGAVTALNDSYKTAVRDLVNTSGLVGARGRTAEQEINAMVAAMEANQITPEQFRANVSKFGQVDGQQIDKILAYRQEYVKHKAMADYITKEAERKSGVSASSLESELALLAGNKSFTIDGQRISAAELLEGIAAGRYNYSATGNLTNSNYIAGLSPQPSRNNIDHKLTNRDTGETIDLGSNSEVVNWLQSMTSSAEYNRYNDRYDRLNSSLVIGNQFQGQYIENPDLVQNFAIRDPKTGQINPVASQKFTKEAREFFMRPGVLNNYTVRSATNFNETMNVSLLQQLPDFPVDSNGYPDMSKANIDFTAQPTVGRGHSIVLTYFVDHDNDKDTPSQVRQGTLRMPMELETNVLTNGRTDLTMEEGQRINSDYYFQSELAKNNQTAHRMHIDPNRPFEVPVLYNNRAVGRFIYSNTGTRPVSLSDQGGESAIKVLFSWNEGTVDNPNWKTADPHSLEASEAFYDLTNN